MQEALCNEQILHSLIIRLCHWGYWRVDGVSHFSIVLNPVFGGTAKQDEQRGIFYITSPAVRCLTRGEKPCYNHIMKQLLVEHYYSFIYIQLKILHKKSNNVLS